MLVYGIYMTLLINLRILCFAQRRIVDGKNLAHSKRYMAYLVKAPKSQVEYDSWICGGAIINELTILTAAACIEDVQYMYAIAGYDRYVRYDEIEFDSCTKNAKKKVTLTCVPKDYEFSYERIDKWSNIDIGIARVESKYDLVNLRPGCSYVPTVVNLNYEKKWTSPGMDVFVMGWGHREKWRKPADATDYNSPTILYGSTMIIDLETCKYAYRKDPTLTKIIEKYMICTNGEGNIDPDGNPMNLTLDEDCDQPRNLRSARCLQYYQHRTVPYGLRSRRTQLQNKIAIDNTTISPISTVSTISTRKMQNKVKHNDTSTRERVQNKIVKDNDTIFVKNGRRGGICQNDHGGPLVTWVGNSEYVIGVASVFRIDTENRCLGPYLHTSVRCNRAFLQCILKNEDAPPPPPPPMNKYIRSNSEPVNDPTRRDGMDNPDVCNLPPKERGFDMVERTISWAGHPDGPADNEMGPHPRPIPQRSAPPPPPPPPPPPSPALPPPPPSPPELHSMTPPPFDPQAPTLVKYGFRVLQGASPPVLQARPVKPIG